MHTRQRYEAYTDSGIDWLGEVPAHWKTRRVKELTHTISKGTTPSTEGFSFTDNGVRFIKAENIGYTKIVSKKPEFYISEEANKSLFRSQLKSKDLLIVIAGATIGKVGIITDKLLPANTNQAVCFVRFKSHNNIDYLYYLFSSDYFSKYIWFKIVQSAQPNLAMGVLGNFILFMPPLPEQTAIADYLDRHTGLLDRKIGLLRRKAARYGSLKQALINETVSRGLDAAAPLKDSGVEWIGQIPAHWEVKRVKEINLIIMGQSPSSSDYTEQGLGYPFLQGNAEFGHYSPTPKVWCSAIKKFAIKNDVLLSVRAPVGAVNVATDSYGIGRGLCAIRSKSNYKFWYYFLTTISAYLNSIATGSTYSAVSIDDVKNTMTPLPTEQEQTAIAAYLDEKTAQIDRIVSAINAQIEKLAELRKTLINDVVTGKIKVYRTPA